MQPPAPLVHTPPPAIPAMPAPRTPAAAVHAAAHRVSQVVPVPGSYANRAGCEHFLQPSPAYIRCPDHYRYLARTQHPFQRRATASGDLPGPDKSTFVQRSGDLALAVTAARSVGFDEAIAMGFRRSAHSHALLAAGQLDPSGRTLRISLTPHGLQ
ncbi:hypothetical protein HK105_204720 [Polyrhizophydium stewartii]|uniref:Uncharacterized protein n=1 Tax=Polyrhizophydium stewartii TaxID=2732419 RepID=A0ABR4N8B2_9FUNG|nr:hypothetical protein HK105_000229 [Polyrhizophydium stewartii]